MAAGMSMTEYVVEMGGLHVSCQFPGEFYKGARELATTKQITFDLYLHLPLTHEQHVANRTYRRELQARLLGG